MAEFKEVIKQRARMCKAYKYCTNGCPLNEFDDCGDMTTEKPDRYETLIMEWASAHPEKTMKDVFFEKFPDAPKCSNGTPTLCLAHIGLAKKMSQSCKGDCFECWSQPAPDNI